MDVSITDVPPPYEERTSGGLLQMRRQSVPARSLKTVVVNYMLRQKGNGLDGSLHPALDLRDPHIKYDRKRAPPFVIDDEETDADTILAASLTKPSKDPDRHKWKENVALEQPCLQVMFQNLEKDEQNFRNAIAKFEQDVPENYRVGIDVSKARSMDDVLRSIHKVMKECSDKEKQGVFGPLRRAMRKIGEHQRAYTSVLKLAPSQSTYCSLICGGVILIVEAAGRLEELNTEIVEAIAEIPLLVDKSQRLLRACPTSAKMQDHCTDLYIAALKALGAIITFCRERALAKAFKLLIKQSSYKRELSMNLVDMRRCDKCIDTEGTTCGIEMVHHTELITTETKKIASATYEKQGETIERLADLERDNAELIEEVRQVKGQLVATKDCLNSIHSFFLAYTMRPAPSREDVEPRPSNKTRDPAEAARSSRKELIRKLGYQRRVTRDDRVENLNQIFAFSRREQDRAVYIMQSVIVRDWLTGLESAVLLINGSMPDYGSRRSPISFVSAKLADSLHQSRKSGLRATIISLQFFCSEHASWREDPDNIPASVWNSLLAQLLLQFDGFRYEDVKRLSELDMDDVESLGDVFAGFLEQLSADHVVFCIVDSISLYDDERRSETELLVEKLIDLAQESSARQACTFKLLLTSPTRLKLNAVDYLDGDQQVLQVPGVLDRGDGFNDMKWEMGVGGDVEGVGQ